MSSLKTSSCRMHLLTYQKALDWVKAQVTGNCLWKGIKDIKCVVFRLKVSSSMPDNFEFSTCELSVHLCLCTLFMYLCLCTFVYVPCLCTFVYVPLFVYLCLCTLFMYLCLCTFVYVPCLCTFVYVPLFMYLVYIPLFTANEFAIYVERYYTQIYYWKLKMVSEQTWD